MVCCVLFVVDCACMMVVGCWLGDVCCMFCVLFTLSAKAQRARVGLGAAAFAPLRAALPHAAAVLAAVVAVVVAAAAVVVVVVVILLLAVLVVA